MLSAFNAFKASIVDFPEESTAPIIAWDGSGNIARLIFEQSFLSSNEKYFFASFISRNQAYRTICKLWNQQIGSSEINKLILNRENSVYLDALNGIELLFV
jgi:hypothetical protein